MALAVSFQQNRHGMSCQACFMFCKDIKQAKLNAMNLKLQTDPPLPQI